MAMSGKRTWSYYEIQVPIRVGFESPTYLCSLDLKSHPIHSR